VSTQTLYVAAGAGSLAYSLDLANPANFGIYEKIYILANTLSNLNMLTIWITDLKILAKFRALDERLTVPRIRWFQIFVLAFFFVTRCPQYIQTGFQLNNDTRALRVLGTIPTIAVALGGAIQLFYCTFQVIFIAKLVLTFAHQSGRKIQDSTFFDIVIFIGVLNLCDWIALVFFAIFTFFGRNYLFNNLVSAMVGIHAASVPVTLSKLTAIALENSKTHKVKPSSRPKSRPVSSRKISEYLKSFQHDK
jgi:hypothetical protein